MDKNLKPLPNLGINWGSTASKVQNAGNVPASNTTVATPPAPIAPIKTDTARIDPNTISTNTPVYNPPTNTKPAQVTPTLDVVASREPIEPAPVSQKDQTKGMIDKLLQRDVVSEKAKLREEAGIQERQDLYNKSLNDYKAKKMSYEDKIEEMRQNKSGMSSAVLANEMEEYQRKANRDLANMAIGVELLQNNYQGAEKILNDQIDDIQTDYDNKLKTAQVAYDFLQNDLTESEKIQAQAEIQRIQDERNFEQEKLLIDYKAQTDRVAGANAPKVVNVNGQDMVFDSMTGTFKPVPVEQADASVQLVRDKAKVDQLSNITSMSGIGSAVGTSIISRSPSSFLGTVGKFITVAGIPGLAKDAWNKLSGNQQNFISEVEQIRSTLNLDTLINAKSQGATFGALSNQELQVLASSATKLGTWAIVDKNGKVVGYNTDQASFRKEIDKINNFAKIDYLLKGGNPEDVGVQIINGQYVTQNSDGSITVLE